MNLEPQKGDAEGEGGVSNPVHTPQKAKVEAIDAKPLESNTGLRAEEPVQFFVLISSYNNAELCKKNLESVFCQTYPNWQIYYVDDCSTDGTGQIVEQYIQQRGFSDKCTVVHNATNQKTCANYYYAIKECDLHKVVVNLDGDDWLAHNQVLEKIAAIYKDPNVWLTYGSFLIEPGGWRRFAEPVPAEVIYKRSFRQYKWVFSHLRTYYAALFQKISPEDFMYNGAFLKVASDVAQMLPLIEMASNGHFRFVEEVLYVYNRANPLSDFRLALEEQRKIEKFIRSKPPYSPLDKLF